MAPLSKRGSRPWSATARLARVTAESEALKSDLHAQVHAALAWKIAFWVAVALSAATLSAPAFVEELLSYAEAFCETRTYPTLVCRIPAGALVSLLGAAVAQAFASCCTAVISPRPMTPVVTVEDTLSPPPPTTSRSDLHEVETSSDPTPTNPSPSSSTALSPSSCTSNGTPSDDIPNNVAKVLKLNGLKGWKLEKTETKGGKLTFETRPVEWCGTKAVRFVSELNCSLEVFVDFFIKGAPQSTRTYDKLLDTYEVLEELPQNQGKVLYTSFFSPVPLAIGRRDFVAMTQHCQLTGDEVREHLGVEAGKEPSNFTRSGHVEGALASKVVCFGAASTTHRKRPDVKGFVRGTAHTTGFIAVELGPGKMQLTEVISLDPNGSIPAFAVDKGNVKLMERHIALRTRLEEAYKKAKKGHP